MKPTFRQFIEDIQVDDSAYTPDDSDSTIDTIQTSIHRNYKPGSGSWKELPLDFGHEGFKVLYKKDSYGEYNIALVDTRDLSKYKMPFGFALPKDPNRVAINVNVNKWHVHLLEESGERKKFYGLKTDVLSGSKSYRGGGLAPLLYKSLVQHGQVLFSSTTQTSGGQSTWQRLTKSVGDIADVGVIVDDRSELASMLYRNQKLNRDLLEHIGIDTSSNFDEDDIQDNLERGEYLVMGSWATLNDIAYDDSEPFWVIAPHGHLDPYKKLAVKVK